MNEYSTPAEAYHHLLEELSVLHGERESKNILNIFFKDLFEISIPSNTEQWNQKHDGEKCLLMSNRLKDGEPIQYLTGKTNFYGYDFKVNRHTLIPRAETEELVYWIIEDLQGDRRQLDVLDIGCGSGCIAITLKLKKPQLRLFALDHNLDTLNVARINAKRLSTLIQFMRIDFTVKTAWEAICKVDIIVSNPPYITVEEKTHLPQHVIDYEPDDALFVDGKDPLLFYKLIAEFGKTHLKEEGVIYLELNEFKADTIAHIFTKAGYGQIELKNDLQGKPRMLRVQRY